MCAKVNSSTDRKTDDLVFLRLRTLVHPARPISFLFVFLPPGSALFSISPLPCCWGGQHVRTWQHVTCMRLLRDDDAATAAGHVDDSWHLARVTCIPAPDPLAMQADVIGQGSASPNLKGVVGLLPCAAAQEKKRRGSARVSRGPLARTAGSGSVLAGMTGLPIRSTTSL